jgi:hypothetical protein
LPRRVAPEQSARAAPIIAFRTLRVLQSIILAAQLVVGQEDYD